MPNLRTLFLRWNELTGVLTKSTSSNSNTSNLYTLNNLHLLELSNNKSTYAKL